ncbi:MAG: hypothetical protein A2Z47_15745 [Thermodesulfovibrio sp. RBG_19FT_COMBO_42_12]|nr:MAG: hypothetical protein A2Z47_15745 [Thermodesulfovibrio sp. RBG_19FT_COMBO_42_12]
MDYTFRARLKMYIAQCIMRGLIIVVAILLVAGPAHPREYKARKRVGNYVLEMKINRNPPIVDRNILTLEIKDSNNKNITDAKVLVNYYMPPMPGMPPMNYKTLAKLSGQKYEVIMDLIMSGPWNIVIKIMLPKEAFSVRFTIDVR